MDEWIDFKKSLRLSMFFFLTPYTVWMDPIYRDSHLLFPIQLMDSSLAVKPTSLKFLKPMRSSAYGSPLLSPYGIHFM